MERPNKRSLSASEAQAVLRRCLDGFEQPSDSRGGETEDHLPNDAIIALKEVPSDATFLLLLKIARKWLSPLVVDTVADYRRPESIPCLIQALENERCGPAAVRALLQFGGEANEALICQSFHRDRHPSGTETIPSLRRRLSCLQALASMQLSIYEQRRLRNLLFDGDPEVVFSTSKLLISSKIDLFRNTAKERLRAVLPALVDPLKHEGQQLLTNQMRADQTHHPTPRKREP